MAFLDLPEELIDLCLSWSTDTETLKSARLTSRQLLEPATRYLFSHILALPTVRSVEKVRLLLEDSRLSPLVTHLTLDLSNCSFDDTARGLDGLYDDDDSDIGSDEGNAYRLAPWLKDVLRQLHRFRNLQRLDLSFDGKVYFDDPDSHWNPQPVEWREVVLREVFTRLLRDEQSAPRFRKLSIKNLQDVPFEKVVGTANFRRMLSKLDTLKLQVAPQRRQMVPPAVSHPFFNTQLFKYWLEPAQSNLVTLKLSLNAKYWGWYPLCDFRTLGSLPMLKDLTLGHYTFTHDWQLEWIISHADTLRSLTLEDCPIVHAASPFTFLCRPDRMPGSLATTPTKCGNAWYHEARWHDYFRRIQDGLLKLKHFSISFGEREKRTAAEEASSLLTGLSPTRYAVYDGQTKPSPLLKAHEKWDDQTRQLEGFLGFNSEWEDDPLIPDCKEEDQEALDRLMAAIASRV